MTVHCLVFLGELLAVAATNNPGYGLWDMKEDEVVVMYHNRSYEHGSSFRDKQLAEIGKRLAAAGLKELGFGNSPADGHTYAIVIAAPRPLRKFILDVVGELITTLREMTSAAPDAAPQQDGNK